MKPFLLITGMHRSGTSFLARALNLSGVYLGELDSLISNDWDTSQDNLRGHWENKRFLELAEKTLSSNNSTWDSPAKSVVIRSNLGEEIKNHVEELLQHPSLATGFKDPRILLCLEAWIKYLPQNFLMVGIFRHPLKVAESLKKRNQFSYEKSLELWQVYNTKLLSFLERHDGFLLDFDWEKEKVFSELSLVSSKIGLSARTDLSEWYSKELLHSELSQKEYFLSEEIQSLYSKLQKRSLKNKEVKITKSTYSLKDALQIIYTLLTDMQRQGTYFRGITESIRTAGNEKFSKIESDYSKLVPWSIELEKLLKEKDSQITKSGSYTSKLEQELKEKDSQITKFGSYTSKLEQEIKEKLLYIIQLDNMLS